MFRGKFTWIVAIALTAGAGCKTTSTATKVDLVRGEVDLYTSADTRSSLTDPQKQDNVREAETRLKTTATKNTGDLDALVNLAQLQVAQGKYKEAEKTCRDVLRNDLRNAPARVVLAQIALRKGNGDLAEIILNGVGGSDSKDSGVLNMLAMIELKRGNNAAAMSLFNKAIKTNGRDLAARMNLGVLQLRYRQLAAAATQFERVLRSLPEHRDAKLHLGIVRAAQGKDTDAEKLFKEVLEGDEKNPIALYNLAVVQKQGDEYDDALDNLKSYLKSTRGKSADNDQVFALIDTIQREKAAKGETVSDEDIQAMAAKMAGAPNGQQVAQAEDEPSPVSVEPNDETNTADTTETPQAELEAAEPDSGIEPVDEDIDSLEAELLK